MAKRLIIRQVKSGLGAPGGQQRTLVALGLRHHQDEVEQPDNPAIRGMIHKVRHLVEIKEAKKNG